MAYEVLARRWRPQQFDDVVGQEHVTKTLKNAITSKRIAHAYLFVGPRGTGKTSMARILAKALNCETGPTVTPCDKCDSCKEIMEGRSLDVLEIDGASNNLVDNVRELRDNVAYMPTRGKFKVYIIDEVHMLSAAAFNALLKTLEEPPPHVKFVFATTEPQKVLATILSRCQRFDLRRIPTTLMVKRLAEVAKDEGVTVDDDALLAIARMAEGGLRDAESALDQLISFMGKKLTEEDVLSVFGLVSRKAIEGIADAILKGDIGALITEVGQLDAAGKDMQRLVIDLLQHFRNVLVCACVGSEASKLDVPEFQMDILKRQGSGTGKQRLLEISGILIDADAKLKYALSKRTLLEMMLIRCARAATVVTIDEIMAKLTALRESAGAVATVEAPVRSNPASPASPQAKPAAVHEAPAAYDKPGDELSLLRNKWNMVAAEVEKTIPLAKQALGSAKVISISQAEVVVGFDPEYEEHFKSFVASKRGPVALKNAIRTQLGRSIEVKCLLNENMNAPSRDHGSPAVPAEQKPVSKKSVKDLMKNDAVRRTLEAFDGQIVDYRE